MTAAQTHPTNHTGASNLCWEITSRCNDNCRFCYRHLVKRELSLDEANRVLDNLVDAGLRKITWTGGEALLYPHTWSLIRHARRAGVQTSLITNTLLLTEADLETHAGDLDWITLSLDGPDADTQARMTRHAGHYDRILFWLDVIQKQYPALRVKINTVAAAPNVDRIPEMASLMARYGVARWKIFRFFPVRGFAERNADGFVITDARFARLYDGVRAQAARAPGCRIQPQDHEEMGDAYISVIPDGSLRINNKVLGSLLRRPFQQLLQRAEFSAVHHRERTRWLYEPAFA